MGKSIKKKRQRSEVKRDPEKVPTAPCRDELHPKQTRDGRKTLSLASNLKRHRGTAESTPDPPLWSFQEEYQASLKSRENNRLYLTPEQDGKLFDSCQKECYRGFVWENPNCLPQSIHTNFDLAFDALYKNGLFLYDAIQAGGKKVSQTQVTRTLIGNPGSTYRYLGLRLFSHPWSTCPMSSFKQKDGGEDETVSYLVGLGYSREVAKALWLMGQLNCNLKERTYRSLEENVKPHVKDGLVGSASYSLTLVNRMEPSNTKRDLKQDPLYGMGKTSVSWHRDSGLMDFSSIAVYHSLRGGEQLSRDNAGTPWRVALRVSGKDFPTPPLAVPLPSGTLYYLLDDFNHKHEHAVLAGQEQVRYSSTHRVAREGRGTWQYIRDKCQSILGEEEKEPRKKEPQAPSGRSKRLTLVKKARAEQQLLQELQFEWLHQWHVQGELHASLHPYWHEPMKLLSKWYLEVEQRSIETLGLLQRVAKKNKTRDDVGSGKDVDAAASVCEDLYDVMIESLEGRIQLDRVWEERLMDPFYQSLPPSMQPYPCPAFSPHAQGSMQSELRDLKATLVKLRKWRAAFVGKKQPDKKRRTTREDTGRLTKKERRKTAPNWALLKDAMK